MGINAHADTFKFTAPIFPNTVYTWNPEEKVATWQDTIITQEEILEAFNFTGLPLELYDQFKHHVQDRAKSGKIDYHPEEVQNYIDNGTWKLVN